jgi:hypothetical protein
MSTYTHEAEDVIERQARQDVCQRIKAVVGMHGYPEPKTYTRDDFSEGYAAGRASLARLIEETLERITHE